MTTLFPPFSILFIWLSIFHLANCDYSPIEHLCTGNIESNDGLQHAVVSMLNLLTKVDSTTGFKMVTLTSTAEGRTVYGLAQCRGDAINTHRCAKCLQQAETALYAKCKTKTQGAIWFDYCFIRFDVNRFFGSWTIDAGLFYNKNLNNTTVRSSFVRAVLGLITDLSYSPINSNEKYFSKETRTNISDLEGVTIYGMAQCTQDLPPSVCNRCLTYLTIKYLSLCGTSVGCALYHTSCFFRYETYNFFLPD